MIQAFESTHALIDTPDGPTPAGGTTFARVWGRDASGKRTEPGPLFLQIDWQRGPLGPPGPQRKEPNGAFVETIIAIARDRLEFYERTRFACDENAQAIAYLNAALEQLAQRTRDREARGVEGTHAV